MSAKILAATGLEIDFSDSRVPAHDTIDVCVDFAAVERSVREQLESFDPELSAGKAPAPDPDTEPRGAR